LSVRIIPRLDIKGPNLVKGIHLEGLRVLGKPERFARYYYETGADELIYMDVVASLYGRNSLLDIVERTSREIFIPLAVGGGLRTLDDIRTVLRAGADKVALNTAAVKRPELIREAALAFGSSTIVVSIEAIRKTDGSYEAYIDYGRERTGLDAVQWAANAVELGAGELLVTSIDREGTGHGFDIELTSRIAGMVPVPVIASGGAGKPGDVDEVIARGRADAVGIASLFHYEFVKHHAHGRDDFQSEGNTEFLRGIAGSSRIEGKSIPEIKRYLVRCGIECRHRKDDSHPVIQNQLGDPEPGGMNNEYV
jgi:imidazole glycerol-phosphate synthase subunit HisF